MAFQFRYVIAVMILLSTMMAYFGRINMSTAIVSMVDKKNSTQNETDNEAKKFDWSQTQQGVILGSFFYGYFIFQIIHGFLADKIGPRILCSIGLLVTGLINLLTPWLAEHYSLFITSRVILGIFQATVFPSAYALMAKWIPDSQRSTIGGLAFVGGNLGTMAASTSAGYLIGKKVCGGWPSVFYVSGGIITVVAILYFILIRDDPESHWLLSEEELEHIKSNITVRSKRSKKPLLKIISSKTVWAGAFTQFTSMWALTVVLTKLPDYMKRVLKLSIEKNGNYTTIMFIFESFSLFFGGMMADYLIKTNYFSKKTVRKLFQSIAQFGGALAMLGIPLVDCDTNLFLVVMIIGMLMTGAQSGGLVPLPSDLSNEFSATIFGIFNMVGMSTGFICPLFIGYILDSDKANVKHQWWLIYYITAGLRVFGGIIFVLFVDPKTKNWDDDVSIVFN